ncbi:DUF4402 domain-containing protein [Altererythrobacter arenosus]|uniref:DUF4402 domain-containing protein n=1 Tax=Altererythrobacter arenosus TaxID=3032592 RepID=A0ABY8FYD8_9SPHN|nr:DUF4402 domain-containing protein [Altererythrobacter sp. CAU 1644]WFL78391.1 DUF4402 domain-containing protein [Altererythrobacter sp. CAU 1644]
MALGCLAAPAAHAQNNAAAPGEAEILGPILFEKIADLDFGPIVPTGTGGTVTINASSGAVTTVGQVIAVGSNQTRALFNVHAPVGVVMIMSGDPSVVLTRVSGTETMTATLSYRHGDGLAVTNVFGLPIGLLATDTRQEIWAGGSLTVAGNQVEGVYQGTFTVSLAFL